MRSQWNAVNGFGAKTPSASDASVDAAANEPDKPMSSPDNPTRSMANVASQIARPPWDFAPAATA